MTKVQQKDSELTYLNYFLKEILVDEKNSVTTTEMPDFILKRGNYNIGLEVVNFYSKDGSDQTSTQVQNSRRLKVISLAKEAYIKKKGFKFEFNICFNPNYPITDINNLVHTIFLFLENYSTIRSKNLFKIPNCEEVNSIYCNWVTYDDADWKLSQVYDVAQLNKKYMANLIHQKNIKLKQYQSCYEYWLLIIIDFWDPAQDQNLLNFINSCDYLVQNNDFKRIYVCKYATKEFIQLIN